MSKALFLGLAAAGFAALSSAEAGSLRVDRSALDSSYGIAQMLDRIDDAAERTCVGHGRTGIWQKRAQLECIAEVRAEMIAKVGDERLAAAAAKSSRFADLQ
jgi:UrcA family protein